MLSEREHQTREVSELYWNSDASVAEIAEELQLSRRALYNALTPALAGAVCPSCGGDLVYTTRSAKAAERAECASCGTEQEPGTVRALQSRPAETTGPSAPIDSEAALLRSRAILLGAAAVAGIAAGAVTALILSRR